MQYLRYCICKARRVLLYLNPRSPSYQRRAYPSGPVAQVNRMLQPREPTPSNCTCLAFQIYIFLPPPPQRHTQTYRPWAIRSLIREPNYNAPFSANLLHAWLARHSGLRGKRITVHATPSLLMYIESCWVHGAEAEQNNNSGGSPLDSHRVMPPSGTCD